MGQIIVKMEVTRAIVPPGLFVHHRNSSVMMALVFRMLSAAISELSAPTRRMRLDALPAAVQININVLMEDSVLILDGDAIGLKTARVEMMKSAALVQEE